MPGLERERAAVHRGTDSLSIFAESRNGQWLCATASRPLPKSGGYLYSISPAAAAVAFARALASSNTRLRTIGSVMR